MNRRRTAVSVCLAMVLAASVALAQAPPDPKEQMNAQRRPLETVTSGALAQPVLDPKQLMDAQREAMKVLAGLDGVWRGPAEMVLPAGAKRSVTQTERVGSFLGGTIKVVEGRGYEADGSVAFNAFGIISYDPAKKAYALRSYSTGHKGDFVLTPTADGVRWEILAGPMTIRHTVVLKDGKWHEVGDRIIAGREPVRFFEMTLTRVGDSDWPEKGAVGPK
ncbi:MAG: DUF1579 domain-containing protein [Thermoanaerobaculia bacterium]